ncbi:unnamed protein product [Effrenium voratum]|nr:unnamed protein product [Effrenium voratum]
MFYHVLLAALLRRAVAPMYVGHVDIQHFEAGQFADQAGSVGVASHCSCQWADNLNFRLLQTAQGVSASDAMPTCGSAVGFGWRLVRRSAANIFPERDDLSGRSEHGHAHRDPLGTPFSKRFLEASFDEFLFSTGDCKEWVVMRREEVRRLVRHWKRSNRSGVSWISSDSEDMCAAFYREGRQDLCGRRGLGSRHGGLNVFVRDAPSPASWGICGSLGVTDLKNSEAYPAGLVIRWGQCKQAHLLCLLLRLARFKFLQAKANASQHVENLPARQLEQLVLGLSISVRGCLYGSLWAPVLWRLLQVPGLQSLRARVVRRSGLNGTAALQSFAQMPWDEVFQRCSSPRTSRCWEEMVGWLSFESSCLLCCNPIFGPRGFTECFDEKFTFELCCSGLPHKLEPWVRELNESTAEALLRAVPRTLQTVHQWRGAVAEVDLVEVEREVQAGCKGFQNTSNESADTLLRLSAEEIRSFLEEGSGQGVWPSVDLYIANNVSSSNDFWSLGSHNDSVGLDGPELLFQAGMLCSQGCCSTSELSCAVKQRSFLGRFAALPCAAPIRSCDFYRGSDRVVRAHALLPSSLPPRNAACQMRFAGTAVLLTQPGYENSGHALSEALFLASTFRMARLGAFGPRPSFWLIPSLSRLWNCHHRADRGKADASKGGAGECLLDPFLPGPSQLTEVARLANPLAHFVLTTALGMLRSGSAEWLTPTDIRAPLECVRHFDAVVQPSRSLVGDASLHNEFRRQALQRCGVPFAADFPTRKRLVLVRRTRHMRSWGDTSALFQGLLHWAQQHGWQVDVATLGEMDPCMQVVALHDASIVITVYSTEHHIASAFMPEQAAMVMLNTRPRRKGPRSTWEDERGPGLERNGSVAKRFAELCTPKQPKPTETEPEAEPELASFMDNSETAANRNLLYFAMNNVSCHRLSSLSHLASRMPCSQEDTLLAGAVSTNWERLAQILDIILVHLRGWLTNSSNAADI